MKNKLVWHEIVLFGVAMLLIGWKLLLRNISFDLSLMWWGLGLVVGFLFIFLDRFVYSLGTHPTESLSMKVNDLFKHGKVYEAVSMLVNERKEQRELVMRSFLFYGVWVILALFTMTTSFNSFARGLMLGIGTHLTFDLVTDYIYDKSRFDLWFWQIKRQVGNEEKKWFFGLAVLFYVLLAGGL